MNTRMMFTMWTLCIVPTALPSVARAQAPSAGRPLLDNEAEGVAGFLEDLLPYPGARDLGGIPNVVAISACSECQTAKERWRFGELPPQWQGVLTHFIVEGLNGRAADDVGDAENEVSAEELFQYARARAIPYGQTPQMYDSFPSGGTGELDITTLPSGQMKRALLIGNQDYTPLGAGGNDLNGPGNDVQNLANALTPFGFYCLQNTNLLASQINSKLRDELSLADNDDLVVFFYSGHGTWVEGGPDPNDPWDQPGGLDEALVGITHSAEFPDILTDDAFRAAIATKKAGTKVVIILDTCFSGGMIEGACGASSDPGDEEADRCFGSPSPDCASEIPAISEWGLTVMTLLTLTAGTLMFRRHGVSQRARSKSI